MFHFIFLRFKRLLKCLKPIFHIKKFGNDIKLLPGKHINNTLPESAYYECYRFDLEKVSPHLSLMGRRADTEISFIYFPADVVPYIQKG